MSRNNLNRKISFIIICLLLITYGSFIIFGESSNKAINENNHASIKLLKEKIQNVMTYQEAIKIIISMYGKPIKFVGSGFLIPQWNINGGILTCHPDYGVVFSKNDFSLFDDDVIYLIDTENKVEENVIGSYIMWTASMDLGLGWLELRADRSYKFKDNGLKEQENNNFFINHLTGSFTIEYLNGIKANDLLENMKKGTNIAKLNFISGSNSETFYLGLKGRILIFKSIDNQQIAFEMYKSWEKFYYQIKNPSFNLLKEKLKNVESYREAYNIIKNFYGDPKRDVGDGILYIPQWDIDGGVLTCHGYEGISYYKDGKTIYLIDTQNKVGDTIQRDNYTMYALSPENAAKKTYVIGYIGLKLNGNYNFELFPTNSNSKELKTEQINNFFINHPEGTYILEYQDDIKIGDLLENIQDNTKLAQISFFAETNKESFDIYLKNRTLILKPFDGNLRTYTLFKYLKNYHVEIDEKN